MPAPTKATREQVETVRSMVRPTWSSSFVPLSDIARHVGLNIHITRRIAERTTHTEVKSSNPWKYSSGSPYGAVFVKGSSVPVQLDPNELRISIIETTAERDRLKGYVSGLNEHLQYLQTLLAKQLR